MTKYSKEFKKEAIRLSDEIGNKKAAAQLGIPYYVGEKLLHFSRVKSKEVFAYLIDRKGSKVNGNKICAVVYEDAGNETSNKSSLRSCIADMKEALHAVGADDVLIKGWDSYAVDTSLIECDYYDWEKNEPYAIHSFHGEYMAQYSWAEETLAYIMNQK